MEINRFFLMFATTMMLIFGGVFLIRYLRSGEYLIAHLLSALAGLLILVIALLWRQKNKER
ncbi:hypothetical protein ACJA3J_12895 [Halobacillus sp. SY10]|uniref:Uncharacterized protein n=1 Tax=Halobacillus aidingensis TaxID=240303 RepID=A0A1H0LQK8_HALAD|nr:hypothetical protein [Halobacillus aidingensis]SDO70478.1 hypothetical protein SAMN05421677_10792 [Halobacillus aidingensis]